MRRALLAATLLIVALAFPSVAGAASASSWRATLVGPSVHGSATTLIRSDGTGRFAVTLVGLAPGASVGASIIASACGTDIGDLAFLGVGPASAAGHSAASRALTSAEVAAFNAARKARHPLSVIASAAGSVLACAPEVGDPSVGTGRLRGTVAAVSAPYDIRYPVVGGIDEGVATEINGILERAAHATVAAFSRDATQSGAPASGFSPSEATQTFSVSLAQPTLLSLGELYGAYMTGAAHGSHSLATYTFDLATGHRYTLSELFRPGTPWLRLLSTESRIRLRAKFHDPSLNFFFNPGTTPSASNFAGWQLVPSGLRITFSEYQVAPYAFGMPSIVVPWATLRPLMNLRAPVATLTSAGPCLASQLSATMSDWDAGAGQRFNQVHLRNVSRVACWLQGTPRSQLVDATGRVLLDSGATPTVRPRDPRVAIAPGASARIDVRASNYCGRDAVDPTHLVLRLPSGGGTVSARPSPAGSTGGDLPPCLGRTVGGTLQTAGWHHA